MNFRLPSLNIMVRFSRSCIALFLVACSCLIGITGAALAAMAIDLGSQSLKIALVKPGVPMEIVLNKDSRRKTPFSVGIKNGERFFGDAAVQFGLKDPANTFTSFLELLGKQFENPAVQNYIKQNPFLKLAADEKRGTVIFKTSDGDFSVEAMMAMILWNARVQCEAFAGQIVKDVVITVPTFFHQAERKALQDAAEIVGLNLLQLITDGSAAALNYGVFRRKAIVEQEQTLLIYDVGFAKTTATLVGFRLAKEKNSKEQYPIVSTLGVGFDRTLGGNELTLRLREHLLQQFVKTVKPKGDIRENARAMAKLTKEAERLKQVLSANADHYAQIESLFEDKDFRLKVSREEFLKLFADLESRYVQPILDALKMAEMTGDKVEQIVLMGGGTRVPRIQELLKNALNGKELGRFLNTDEASALGAVYQAAHHSKGFKALRFDVQELQLYPVQVQFASGFISESEGAATTAEPSIINRILYGYKSYFPAPKKVISFTSHHDDFEFNMNYGSLNHFSEEQLTFVGAHNITKVGVKGVGSALATELTDKTASFKGVKVHFRLDNVGVVQADHAELIVERMEPVSNSTLSKIVGKIGEFFSDSGKLDPGKIEDEKKLDENTDEFATENTQTDEGKENENKPAEEEKDNSEKQNKEEKQPESDKSEKTEESKKADDKTNEEDKGKSKDVDENKVESKPKVLKIPLKMENNGIFLGMNAEEIKAVRQILADYAEREKQKIERDAALNSLEAAVYDLSSKLDEENFKRFCTTEELSNLEKNVSDLKTWLEDEVSYETAKSEFETKKKDLDALVKKIRFRKRQNEERGKYVEQLEKALNDTTIASFKTISSVFTEVELSTLDKLLEDTKAWLTGKKEEQSKLTDNQDPAFTVFELKEKTSSVEREIKYLLNKMYAAKLKEEQEKLEKIKREAKEAAEKAKKSKKGAEKEDANGDAQAEENEKSQKDDVEPKPNAAEVKDEESTILTSSQTVTEESEPKAEDEASAPKPPLSHDADEL